jgi:glyoxylase-like metal-dependent hydrolase (beta-lactamase superfamily II)
MIEMTILIPYIRTGEIMGASTQADRERAELPARRIEGFAVVGGIWATAVPFPSPLAYSFSYLLRFPAGIVVVDLGWDCDEAWQAFQAGLRRSGASLDDVIGVVVTHAHPDHYGLASRIRTHTRAWIGAHPGERAHILASDAERHARRRDVANWLAKCGVPGEMLTDLDGEHARMESALASVVPDVELSDGIPVPDTGGALVPIHTPGHTVGHLCFHDRERGALFTGDHVLPKVTPNVALRPGSAPDPLRDFVQSLHRLDFAGERDLVLPGHEWSFDRLSVRLDALRRHHEERLREVAAAVRAGRHTVWEVAGAISWARPFPAFTPRSLRSALAETYSHLVRLSEEGQLERRAGVPERWTAAASAGIAGARSAD